jgi:hypothetical protein
MLTGFGWKTGRKKSALKTSAYIDDNRMDLKKKQDEM